jgi:CCR4-NOT complex subunit CAF16
MKCIEIQNLTFKYENQVIFKNLSLELLNNNFYVLSGLNGCGKSTLLKIIGGKTACEFDKVKVLDRDPFRNTSLNNDITFINNDWGMRAVAFCGVTPLQSSLKVNEMMVKLKEQYPERSNELIKVLDINPEWRLNSISEGQRKRVQLYLNLLQPFKVCLLDEITVNLDLLVKDKFMKYLKKEIDERKCCVIYVTHIFDGLEEWATQLIYLKKNKEIEITPMTKIENIYTYLLYRFKLEYDENVIEEEANNYEINMKNAGGYSNGTLINLQI